MWMEAGQQHQQRVLRGYLRLLGTLDPNAESTKSNIPERASPLSLIGQTPASPASALSPAHLRRKLSSPVSTSLLFSALALEFKHSTKVQILPDMSGTRLFSSAWYSEQ
jgi:hypothetical protein